MYRWVTQRQRWNVLCHLFILTVDVMNVSPSSPLRAPTTSTSRLFYGVEYSRTDRQTVQQAVCVNACCTCWRLCCSIARQQQCSPGGAARTSRLVPSPAEGAPFDVPLHGDSNSLTQDEWDAVH